MERSEIVNRLVVKDLKIDKGYSYLKNKVEKDRLKIEALVKGLTKNEYDRLIDKLMSMLDNNKSKEMLNKLQSEQL